MLHVLYCVKAVSAKTVWLCFPYLKEDLISYKACRGKKARTTQGLAKLLCDMIIM